jgi:hypothetical protein
MKVLYFTKGNPVQVEHLKLGIILVLPCSLDPGIMLTSSTSNGGASLIR